MAEHYENLEKALCKELERLDKKYSADVEMSEQDLKRADELYHALKSAETYHAMRESREEADGYSNDRRPGRTMDGGYSYMRVIRPVFPRYPRTMDGGYSGHYPYMDYPESYSHPDWPRGY